MNTKTIRIDSYDYPLPDERIAKYPVSPRDSSKLLVYNKGTTITDTFANVARHLPEGALMVFNNTKVIQARMHFRKATGALIEVFLLEPYAPADYERIFQTTARCSWLCLVGNAKKWKDGALLRTFDAGDRSVTLAAMLRTKQGDSYIVDFEWDNDSTTFADIIDAMGELPIPPYLNRDTQESDKQTYQTVYSKIQGSVAAPTAGLHFTDRVLASIDRRGIEREELTLHVGAGTFRPVKSDTIAHHLMHNEYVCVKQSTIERLIAHDGKAIAVGTTSVRTLESLYYIGLKILRNPRLTPTEMHVEQWEPYEETGIDGEPVDTVDALKAILEYMKRNALDALRTSTQIIIAPGYRYKIVRMLITNFHQPKSTLLLLVSAFIGDSWRDVYNYALENGFRFLSYGDSSLLIP